MCHRHLDHARWCTAPTGESHRLPQSSTPPITLHDYFNTHCIVHANFSGFWRKILEDRAQKVDIQDAGFITVHHLKCLLLNVGTRNSVLRVEIILVPGSRYDESGAVEESIGEGNRVKDLIVDSFINFPVALAPVDYGCDLCI